MKSPKVSIIIPTYNRPQFLPKAVQSALNQTVEDIEVLVVDDGSKEPVELPEHPKLRILRLSENKGNATARNIGAKAARGTYINYLDDDDQLLPNMLETSLNALSQSNLPRPIAALSGLAVVDPSGTVIENRLPPTLPKGSLFFLEEIEPDKSFISKQTLVIERDLFLEIGGYDEQLKSRVHTEFFLRLNPVCSILGVSKITYYLTSHEGPRISKDPSLRQTSFQYLIHKHQDTFKKRPKAFSNFVYQHALMSYKLRQKGAAFRSFLWAFKIHPLQCTKRLISTGREILFKLISTQHLQKLKFTRS